jgi:NADH:ubiquinone oxidoreductase subunit 6 (subunit J)
MVNKVIFASFILFISIAYLGFITNLNFDFSYKVLLYLPAIFFLILFMFLGFRNGDSGSSNEVGGFPYEY